MSLFSRRQQFSWVPLPSCPPPQCSFQWDLLLCQHMCLLRQFIYKSSVMGPKKGSPFLQLVRTLLRWDWHPDHSGYSEASLPANVPDPAAATGTLLSLVSSWCRQLARVPWLVRNKLLTSLPFPLSVLSLALPILPVFLIPWSWTQVLGWRATA